MRIISAIGLDSQLEFVKLQPLRYATVLNKPFASLKSFSISLWIKVTGSLFKGRNSTLLSYSTGLKMYLNPALTLVVLGEVIKTRVTIDLNTWTHVVWVQWQTGQ